MSNSPFRSNVNANVNNGYSNRRFEKRPARPRVYHNEVDEFKNKYDQSRGAWHIAKDKVEEQDQDQENADVYEHEQLTESHEETDYYFSSPTASISCSKCGTCFDSRNNLFRHLRII